MFFLRSHLSVAGFDEFIRFTSSVFERKYKNVYVVTVIFLMRGWNMMGGESIYICCVLCERCDERIHSNRFD